MSQEKVNRYKEYKKNRDQILKRQKLITRIEIAVFAVVACVFVCWFGWSVYHNTTASKVEETAAAEMVTLDVTDYANYVSALQSTFTA